MMRRVPVVASLALLSLAGLTIAAPTTLSFPNSTVAPGSYDANAYPRFEQGGNGYNSFPNFPTSSPDFSSNPQATFPSSNFPPQGYNSGTLPPQGGSSSFPQQGFTSGQFPQAGYGANSLPPQGFGGSSFPQTGFSGAGLPPQGGGSSGYPVPGMNTGAPFPNMGYSEGVTPNYGYQPYQPMPQRSPVEGHSGQQGSYSPSGYQAGFPGGYQPYQPSPAAYPSPGETLQYGIERLTAWLNSRPQGQPAELRRFLLEEIGPLLDFDTMTRWALGPMNRTVTSTQYGQVRVAVENMFLDAMSRQLAGHAIGNIEYLRPRGNIEEGEVQLGIRVSRDGAPLELQFRLSEGPFGWRVIDVEAGGASAVHYYRQMLSEMASRYGVDGMVMRLGS